MSNSRQNNTTKIQVLGNIYNNIAKGVELGKSLIMLQGSARAGKTYNTMIYIIQVCLSTIVKVTIVRQSLPVIKRSVLEDFKDIMLKLGIFEDKRFNKTECKYYFANGSVMEFFSADDEQKLRGSYRDILYINEANEISFYAFSMLRQRTYKYTIVDYNPSFTEEHWLYPLMSDSRSYHFISTFMDNVFLPEPAREEILSYKQTNPALWQIFGLGQFAIVDGLVFPKENWNIIPNDEYPSWKKEEVLGLDWGFSKDPSTAVGVIIMGDDIFVREIYYEYGLQTQDIAERLVPYSSNYKYCDIDNRLITELEMNGVTLLNPTKKNGDSILSGIRIMNQKHIHITESSTDVIKEFKNYVYKKDRNGVTMYDKNPVGRFDHCFTGETLVRTLDGEKRIDEIKVGDFVYTSKGIRRVIKTFNNGVKDVLEIKLDFENGKSIIINSTYDHKVKTKEGWKKIGMLEKGDVIYLFNVSMGKNITFIKEKNTSPAQIGECTLMYGSTTMEKFQKAIIFITKMGILGIIRLVILRLLQHMNTLACTLNSIFQTQQICKKVEKGCAMQERSHLNGTKAKTVESFIQKLEECHISGGLKNLFNANVVETYTKHTKGLTRNSARINANQSGEETKIKIMKQGYAKFAEKNLKHQNTSGKNVAVEIVLKDFKVLSRKREETYNLMIDDIHEYFANGLLVSNCVDAIRYAVLAEFTNTGIDEDIPLTKESLNLFI